MSTAGRSQSDREYSYSRNTAGYVRGGRYSGTDGRRFDERDNDYVYGNAARATRPEYDEREYEEQRRRALRVSEGSRARRALKLNGVSVFFLAVVSVMCLSVGTVYLGVRSQIQGARDHIAELKADIDTLTAKNEAVNYTISESASAESIIKAAKKELGMVEAGSGQIESYMDTDKEYTIQYEDIPNP